MDQFIGKMLDDRYELLELIGSGGMANVYKAKCHRLNRLVAVKILKSELAENADFRRRFRDESLAVARLSHANIVSVYDVSSSDGIEYIVMELIDGITLKQYMERRGQMDWREALHFITQIMRGLSHAHSRGIIHRDIKPQNIMILRDGSVKVADFGIACLANTANTLTQEALGSVHYISPEQARGDRTDARSDVYSAGVVLYEMITGRLPFEGDSAVSVAIQHLSSVPLAPRDINPDIPEALELICMKAMNPDLGKRYASADAMLEDLEKFRKDPAVDMEYIRSELAVQVDDDPTMPVPTAEVASAVRKKKQQEKPEKPDKPRTDEVDKKKAALVIVAVLAALSLLAVLFITIFGGFGERGSGKSYDVPNVIGLTVDEANALEEVKDIWYIDVVGTKADANFQPGQIVEQDPTVGHTRKSNFVIQVYLCAEEETNRMPTLEGMEFRSAKIALQNMNLNLQIAEPQYEASNDYPKDQVITTIPAAGSEIKKGDTVTLVVSSGPATVVVISFMGKDVQDAIRQAEEMGLSVDKSRNQTGTVVGQSIPVGETVETGSLIEFDTLGGVPTNFDRTVSFTVPDDVAAAFADRETIDVTFYQDGALVGSTKIAPDTYQVNYTFTGSNGSTSKVEAQFNLQYPVSTEVTF